MGTVLFCALHVTSSSSSSSSSSDQQQQQQQHKTVSTSVSSCRLAVHYTMSSAHCLLWFDLSTVVHPAYIYYIFQTVSAAFLSQISFELHFCVKYAVRFKVVYEGHRVKVTVTGTKTSDVILLPLRFSRCMTTAVQLARTARALRHQGAACKHNDGKFHASYLCHLPYT